MIHPSEWPVLPKDYRIITTRKGEQKVAAMMPYPTNRPEDAACLHDEAYIEETPKSAHLRQYMQSRCDRCPVQRACLEWAVAHEGWGIWGGTVPEERARIREARGQLLLDPMNAHEYGMGEDILQIYNWTGGDSDGEDQAD